MNRKLTTADILNAEVIYHGLNPVGSHQWANGSPLITDITPTIDEGIERWGQRINTQDRYYKQSINFADGRKSKTYAPRQGSSKQEKLEYGLGYIRGRLDEMKKAATIQQIQKQGPTPPAPVQSVPEEYPEPTPPATTKALLSQSIANIAKRRGRPPKAQ